MLKVGLEAEAMQLDAELVRAVLATSKIPATDEPPEGVRRPEQILDDYAARCATLPERPRYVHGRDSYRSLVKSFVHSMPKSCANCGGHSPTMRKDANGLIFKKTLTKKQRLANMASTGSATSDLALDVTQAANRRSGGRGGGEDEDEDDDGGGGGDGDDAGKSGDDDDDGDGDDDEAKGKKKKTKKKKKQSGGDKPEEKGKKKNKKKKKTAKKQRASDDDGGEDEDSGGSGSGSDSSSELVNPTAADDEGKSEYCFVLPQEVEAQIQLLWRKEYDLIPFVWSTNTALDLQRLERAASSASGGGSSDAGGGGGGSGSGGGSSVNGGPSSSSSSSGGGGSGGGGGSNHVQSKQSFADMFFIKVIPVLPSRFRPPTKRDDLVYEHQQNMMLQKILDFNEQLVLGEPAPLSQGGREGRRVSLTVEKMTRVLYQMQECANAYLDSSKAPQTAQYRDIPAGVRQLLEKKEGLFRKNLMGKRVNFAARSVISPDPFLKTHEIGLPERFARELTYREPVAPWNVDYLRQLVLNGAHVHPGANFVEDEHGRKTDLSKLSREKREAISRTLLTKTLDDDTNASMALTGGIGGGSGIAAVKSKKVRA
jgi:DNA-directed RNA polymerase I subunit RPA1